MANPKRMCIVCKKRDLQDRLIRLQCIGKEIVKYRQTGRSFYICKKCTKDNHKVLLKAINHKCKKKFIEIPTIITTAKSS